MRALMSRFLGWLRRTSTTFPTPEQQEVLEVVERVERKLEARRQDRQRMMDLHVDVLTRQEPDDVS
jgi:hypothetical protein